MKDESYNIPFQVESLIQNMLDAKERPHIRENYRMRLESIRDSINKSIYKYENEAAMNGMKFKKRA